jgi:hypothetical protein
MYEYTTTTYTAHNIIFAYTALRGLCKCLVSFPFPLLKNYLDCPRSCWEKWSLCFSTRVDLSSK